MIWFYYTIFALVMALAGPFLLLQPKARIGLWQKFGIVPDAIASKIDTSRPAIWFHAVSVGEFNAIAPLLQSFRTEHPDFQIYVSTTTGTSQKLAKERVGDWATVFHFPFDLPWALRNWLNCIKPIAVVIAETELWPGFAHECSLRGIKSCIVNGRISPRSFKGYMRLRWLFQALLRQFAAVGVQSEQESLRYRTLGAKDSAVQVCGNMKFDGIKSLSATEQQVLRKKLNIGTTDLVIVGGSTHESEESALLEALAKLPAHCRLILAPRHPERFARVSQIVQNHGYRPRRYSADEQFERQGDVYVLDTIGQLTNFYSLSSIAFVGGTIAKIGGHSLIEPFAYSTPVVCGPHTEKTRDVASALLQRNALLQVPDASALVETLKQLCDSESTRRRYGAAGREYLDQSQGAVQRTMNMLNSVLSTDRRLSSQPTGSSAPMQDDQVRVEM